MGGFLLDLRKALGAYKDRWYSFDLALGAFLAQLGMSNEGEQMGASDTVLDWVSTVAQDFGVFGTIASLTTQGINSVYRAIRNAQDQSRAGRLQPQLNALMEDILANGDVVTEQPRIVDELLGLLIPELEELPPDRPLLVVFLG